MRVAAAIIALFGISSPAFAEAPQGVATIDIIPGWQTPSGTRMVGLKITLADGWKTYWRAPGDAGIPPQFEWTGSENISGAAFHWPTPELFDTNGAVTIGYHGTVVIPIELTGDGDTMYLSGEVDMGVCNDICVPVSLNFNALLADKGGPNAAIAGALIDQPMTADRANVSKVQCSAVPIRDGLRLTASIEMPTFDDNEFVVVEAPGAWVSESHSTRDGGVLTATVDVVPMVQGYMLDRSKIRLTVLGAGRAVDIQGCTG